MIGENTEKITIEITAEELAVYEDFRALYRAGVFSFKNGQAIIHRDNDGNLRQVWINIRNY